MMLILKYFLVVGAVLTLGLIALNAHLLPNGSTAPAPVMHSPTTASLPTITPNVPAADTNVAAEPSQPPPAKSASSARRSHHSARVQRHRTDVQPINWRLLLQKCHSARISDVDGCRRSAPCITLFDRHGSPSWPWRMLLRERAPAVRSPTAGALLPASTCPPVVRSPSGGP